MKLSTVKGDDLVKLAEGDHALNLAMLERLFDKMSELAFFVKDREGRYLVVNHSLVERHGFTEKSQVLGKRPDELCKGPFGEVPSTQDAKVLETGRPLVNHLEMQWFSPECPCWCLTTKLPLREDGAIVGLIGFSSDLQDRISPTDIPANLALVLERIEAEGACGVTPGRLAEEARLSPAKLARVLKRVFGMSPSQYLSRVRLNAASRLLKDTELTVSEVAVEVGFADHSAFTRAFRGAMGMTPSAYRESLEQES